MNVKLTRIFWGGVASLMLLSSLTACSSGSTSAPEKESPSVPASTPSGTESKEPSALPSAPDPSNGTPTPSEEPDPQLPVNKSNALEKLNDGFKATMSASSLALSGVAGNYSAGAGKGDTVNLPISFLYSNSDGTFKATLSYAGSANNAVCYFEGNKKYTQLTDTETGEVTVQTESSAVPFTPLTSIMPVISSELSVVSYENVFKRFCQADFDVDFENGAYVLYFYGTYTQLARILTEDDVYEKFLEQKVEEQFATTAGMIEIFLTEDGYFKGMNTEFRLESPERTLKTTLEYTFTSINEPITVEKPDFVTEA
jgi:hypothetical protein